MRRTLVQALNQALTPALCLAFAALILGAVPACHDAAKDATTADDGGAAGPDTASTEVDGADEAQPDAAASHRAAPSSDAAERQLFFGDLHVHTGWSFDAFESGVRTGPADAYRFARGEAIPHAAGGTIELAGPPLDFIAVTDHAEYLGVSTAGLRPEHPLHRQPLIQHWLGQDRALQPIAAQRLRASYGRHKPFPALIDDEVVLPAWAEAVALANEHDAPGTFTALVGFEYSSSPDAQNLHRNVIFRGARVPKRPFSAFDSENPEALWRWMDEARASGDDLIAIPHNGNGSNGLMFAPTRFDGSPIDAAWAAQRGRNEPVAELIQIKGQSETTPELSPGDEWADFEVVPWRTLDPARPSRASGSYVREALGVGLGFRASLGVDPFALGFVGSTDTHNSASPVVESAYFGKLGRADGGPAARLGPAARPDEAGDAKPRVAAYWGAAGLAGVWARENTRAALFDALRRRETFATSGPRIRVRFFAGPALEPGDGERPEARADPVPMGSELIARPSDRSPRFRLTAQRDPLEARLERAQIIKLWREGDRTREAIFDVACAGGEAPDPKRHRCPHAAPPPDPADCRVSEAVGARELEATWTDPAFDPGIHALYFARVLQIPTCRWTTFDALRLGRPPLAGIPATIQERALTSPIWIRPAGEADEATAAAAAWIPGEREDHPRARANGP